MIIERYGRPVGSAVLLISALLLGGGHSPIRDMIVELFAAALLAIVFVTQSYARLSRQARLACFFMLAVLALPLLQMVPLPASIWQGLPGRELAAQLSQLVGQQDLSRPISLDPEATFRSATALLPPIAIFLATLSANAEERERLMKIVALGAGASLILAALQRAGGAGFDLFDSTHSNYPIGLFANRNHQADLLLIGMAAIGALWSNRDGNRRLPIAILCLIALAVGVLATGSRAGTVLLLFVVPAVVILLRGRIRTRTIGPTVLAISVILPIILVLGQSSIVRTTLGRFQDLSDLRPTIWHNTIYAVRTYWPIGSGFGTFVPVYNVSEGLDGITSVYINHAHSDYLELLLEGGVAAGALVLAYFALLATRLVRLHTVRYGLPAAIAITVLLAHSAVDYPLRTLSLATIFGLLSALLYSSRDIRSEPAPADRAVREAAESLVS
jgi:O-antigen ligase